MAAKTVIVEKTKLFKQVHSFTINAALGWYHSEQADF
jgi:hypothetical protein